MKTGIFLFAACKLSFFAKENLNLTAYFNFHL
jgi:hypothetical protein